MLNAAVLGGGFAALLFFGLRGFSLHAWVPGVAAIVAGVLFSLFGLVAVGWATAFLIGLTFAAGAAFAAHELHLWWEPLAALGFGLGLFGGMVNHKGLSLILPPLFSALFTAVGCAIAWAPNKRGAKLPQLLEVDWVLGLAGVLAFVLLAFSLERNHRWKLRMAARTKRMDDEKLKRELESRQAKYKRAIDQASRE